MVAGGLFVLYGRHGDQLLLLGVDPATGKTRWQQPAGVGTATGAQPSVAVSQARVAYLRPDPKVARRSIVVVADATTGTDLVRSSPGFYAPGLGACSVDPGDWSRVGLCVSRQTDDQGGWTTVRSGLDLRTGGLSGAESQPSYEATGVPGLRVEIDIDGRRLIGSNGGQDRWTSSLAAYVEHADTRGPLTFRRYGNVAVGTAVLIEPVGLTAEGATYHLDPSQDVISFGVDLSSGKLLWRVNGAASDCLTDSALRCRYVGRADIVTGSAGPRVASATGLAVSVERFDPATGRPSWTANLGRVPGLLSDPDPDRTANTVAPAVVGAGQRRLVLGPSTPEVVDLGTGKVGPPAVGEVFWCPAPPSAGSQAGGLWQPCDAQGSPVSLPGETVPVGVGAAVKDGTRVIRGVAEPDALAGYELLPSDPSVAQTASSPTGQVGPVVAGPAAPTLTRVWSNSSVLPLSAPVVVGGTAVYYATADRLLYLVGLDPQTGRQRWQVPATVAFLDKDDGLSVRTFGDRVLYFEDAGVPLTAFLDSLDPATGRSLRLTQAKQWDSQPSLCDLSVTEVCLTARADHVDHAGSTYAVDVAHGTIRDYLAAADDVSGWQHLVGPLYSHGTGAAMVLARLAGSVKIWQRSLTDLFGPGTDSITWQSLTWNDETFVLTALRNVKNSGDGRSAPLSMTAGVVTVSLYRATGALLWRDDGVSTGCFHDLPQPANSGVVFCRYTGTLEDNQGETFGTAQGLTVTVQQLDRVTGKPVWSTLIGAMPDLARPYGNVQLMWAGAGRLVVRNASGAHVLDLGTGVLTGTNPTDVFWCERTSMFEQDQTYWVDGQPVTTRSGSNMVEPCLRDGTAVDAAPTNLGQSQVAVAGALRLVSTPQGVMGFRMVS